jgi:predicted nucleotidyltransferase
MCQRNIEISKDVIEEFCLRNHIRKLSLFGSVLREDFGPESDVDILVEFEPDAHIGLGICRMARELSEMLGRRVDLRTPAELSRYFRQRVLDTTEVQFSTR